MPLTVGNLLDNPAANSFISLSDATEYLTDEGAGYREGTALGDWFATGSDVQESALVRASRWMATNLPWCSAELEDDDLVRVGRVAARLSVDALTTDLWSAETLGKDAKRYKAGSVEVEYHSPAAAHGARAGGKRFPWVYPMLKGLLRGGNGQHDVVRR